MGILDVPKGLISRLPLIGGSDDSKSKDEEKPNEPVDEAPDTETEDEPDEVEETEDVEQDEPDEVEESDEPDSNDDQPDSDPDGSGGEAEQPSGSDSNGSEDISDITAPSIGPNTTIEKEAPEERLARHEQSDKDAMGLDKRREVIGGNYSASFGKQLIRWAVVVLVIAGAAFGAKLLVDDLDKPPAQSADEAPWAGNDEKPTPLE